MSDTPENKSLEDKGSKGGVVRVNAETFAHLEQIQANTCMSKGEIVGTAVGMWEFMGGLEHLHQIPALENAAMMLAVELEGMNARLEVLEEITRMVVALEGDLNALE